MKTNIGLIVAIFLGLAGALLNWVYLTQKSHEVESVAFLGVAPSVSVRRGDIFREEHFVPVKIPRSSIGQLGQFAVLYDDRSTVIGMRANDDYAGGELLLRQDLKTPPPEIKLQEGKEVAIFVPVDTRSFVPSLVTPGDWVSFIVAAAPTSLAPSDDGDPEAPPTAPLAPTQSEMIGPFKVLSLGNRLGSAEVFKASGIPQQQENVMTILIPLDGNDLNEAGKRLFRRLQQSSMRGAGVVLHPKPK